jgi:hypothetical protein
MSNLNIFIPITKVDAAKRIVYGTLTQAVPDKSGEIIDYATTKAAYQKWSDDAHARSKGKSRGNLRAMHASVAAGKFTDIVFDDENERIEGAAYVSDDNEWKKCEDGTYTGFSHGGSYAKRWKDPDDPKLTRYTPELAEVSLVDNPCVPTATFEFIKEDGSTELRKFNTTQEAPMKKDTKAEDQATEAAVATPAADTTTEPPAAAEPTAAEPVEKAADPSPTEAADRPQDKGGVVQGFMAKDGSFHVKKADALKRNIEADAEAIAAPAIEAVKNLTDAVAKAEGGDQVTPAAEEPAEAEPAADPAPAAEDAKPDKAAPADDLTKGMYDVCRFAELLQAVLSLQQDTQWEAQWEGDNSELPARLKAWLADGGTLLVQMVGEETAELTAAKAAAPDELAKKGAALSAATKAHVEAMHKSACDHMAEVGKCYTALGLGGDAAKSNTGDLTKAADDALRVENTALKKVLGDLAPQIDALTKRLEAQQAEIRKLADQPLPPKGSLRAVDKTTDGGNVSDGDDVKKFQDLTRGKTPEEVSQLLMKAALNNPQPVR